MSNMVHLCILEKTIPPFIRQLVLPVQDKLAPEAPDGEPVEFRTILVRLIAQASNLRAPLVVESNVGENREAAH